jgi:hypothetical protein
MLLLQLWEGLAMTGRSARTAPWGGVVGAVICGFFGLIAAVIVSVNLAINAGVPGGYEAGPAEVFQHSPIAGVINVLVMVGGPALGAWLGWVIGRRATR